MVVAWVNAFAPGLFVSLARAACSHVWQQGICCGTHGADFIPGSGAAVLWCEQPEGA